MSSGGIFTLLTNDGNQDKLLLASAYLKNRLIDMKHKHTNYNTELPLDESWTPDINMIKKTHFMFVDNSYKPFVASGFEYNKVQTTGSGSVNFGTKIVFDIPVFGDFVNDVVVHMKLTGLAAVNASDRVRYTSMLGHKIFSNINFSIHGLTLDEYSSDEYNAFYEFHVPENKKIGWLRNVGQEIPNQAFLTSDPAFDTHREYRWFGDGNQTLKHAHPMVELWVPLLFWFKELRNAFPNIAIPYGQTKICLDIADISEIVGFADYGGGGAYISPKIETCELYMNNIFVNPEIHNIFIKKFGFSLVRVHTRQFNQITRPTDNILLNRLKWPTETIYIAFKPQSNIALSQYWHKSSVLEITDIKVPVVARDPTLALMGTVSAATSNTATLIGVSGAVINTTITDFYNDYTFQITGGTGYSLNDKKNRYTITAYNPATQTITIGEPWSNGIPDSTTTYDMFVCQLAINVARYYKETPSIDTIKIEAHGIVIYRETSESFYNSYLPYRFGDKGKTPNDRGWYMVNFNFFPGEHQPSGYINLSRAREFYIKYTSSFINTTNPVDLIVLADSINFLLIQNGGAVLRYST